MTEDALKQARTTVAARPALANRFKIISLIGQGSAGAVYAVEDLERGGERVALKILRDQNAFDSHTMQRFIEELQVCQRIKHPNLVEAYELLELADTVAFSMELVEGKNLVTLIGAKPLSTKQLAAIFIQTLHGLEALHRRDLVHRDIKPDNILLRSDGTVKVADLGLVKFQGVGAGETRTQAGILLGTPQYMPPEYIRKGVFDQRGDLYSLGIVLYELLTGERRFWGWSGQKILAELLRTDFYIPSTGASQDSKTAKLPGWEGDLELALPRSLPGGVLSGILQRATSVDPGSRYQNAAEMREEFLQLGGFNESVLVYAVGVKNSLQQEVFALISGAASGSQAGESESSNTSAETKAPTVPTPSDSRVLEQDTAVSTKAAVEQCSLPKSVVPPSELTGPQLGKKSCLKSSECFALAVMAGGAAVLMIWLFIKLAQ